MFSDLCAILSGCYYPTPREYTSSYQYYPESYGYYPDDYRYCTNRVPVPLSYFPTTVYPSFRDTFARPLFVGNPNARSHRVNRCAEPYLASQRGCREPVGLRAGYRR